MRVAVIINPIAGRSRREASTGAADRDAARAWLDRRGIDGEVAVTAARGHARDLAGEYAARGFDRVIAWGGDGTVNETAGPLIGSRVALGIVRAGSGDGLARGLGVARAVGRALDDAVRVSPSQVDVGWIGSRHFLNVGGFGFDAAVARVFDARRARGVLGYLAAGAGTLWTQDCSRYRLRIDDENVDGRQFLVAFANGTQYGNGLVIAPGADPTDGLLDAVIVAAGPRATLIWRLARLYVAPQAPGAGVSRRLVRRATVSSDHLLAHVDGEPFDVAGPVDVRVEPAALWVAAPRLDSPAADGG